MKQGKENRDAKKSNPILESLRFGAGYWSEWLVEKIEEQRLINAELEKQRWIEQTERLIKRAERRKLRFEKKVKKVTNKLSVMELIMFWEQIGFKGERGSHPFHPNPYFGAEQSAILRKKVSKLVKKGFISHEVFEVINAEYDSRIKGR